MKKDTLSAIHIRSLQQVEELELVRELEALVWSMKDSVPVNHTIASVKNGGFVLGAFLDNKLIGFQYSFPGFNGKSVYLCSHSLGIHPDYRKYGIGEKLKLVQKETAIEMGYDLITWTYDPLETVNGNLNLHKLGAICSTYMKNAYGKMDDNLNAGIDTDRFLVEWWIKKPFKSKQTRSLTNIPFTIETGILQKQLIPVKVDLTHTCDSLFVPVPGNFQELKNQEFSLALKWRKQSRKVFTHYLTHGWVITDLVKDQRNQCQYLYLLEKPKN